MANSHIVEQTKILILRDNIKLKKKLGQNFLINKNTLEKIIKFSEVQKEDIVLEIGTGSGILTNALSDICKMVISYEIDKKVFNIANEILSGKKNITLINDNFIKVNLSFLENYGRNIKIVANVPYYITTPLLEKIITNKNLFSEAFLTVQKEFANRITAKAGSKNYGSFSIYINYFCETKKLFDISKNDFFPRPDVDSSFIKLAFRKEPPIEIKDEDKFFGIVRASFNQRRKTLLNSLSNKFDENDVKKALKKANIDPKRRGETLSMEEFAKLANCF